MSDKKNEDRFEFNYDTFDMESVLFMVEELVHEQRNYRLDMENVFNTVVPILGLFVFIAGAAVAVIFMFALGFIQL